MEFIFYICCGFGVGYAYYHPYKVRAVLAKCIDYLDARDKEV